MKIGVISDTHLSGPTQELEELMRGVFAPVDLILHAGDLVELDVLRAFEGKEVAAVQGNMDSRDVKRTLPERLLLELGGFRVGLTHGWGAPFGIERKIRTLFQDVDIIVFGHTHRPVDHVVDGVRLFNPGTFAGGWIAKSKRTVGLLTLEDSISGTIVTL